MTRNILNPLALFLFLILPTGCANLSTLQTAHVEPPKTFKMTLGLGYQSLTSTAASGLGLPYFTAMGRIGVVNKLDMGVRATLIGSFGVDAKYQILDTSHFALSAGLGFNIWNYSIGSTYSFTIPIYLTYDVSDMFAIYSAPRFTGGLAPVSFTSGGTTVTGTGFAPYLGGSLGVKVGRKVGGMVEASFANSLNTALPNLVSFDAAVYFGL